MLLPGLRPLRRNKQAVQLGMDSRRAVVLDLVDPSAGRLLDLLDGSRTEQTLLREAARLGMSEAAARTLLADLTTHGLVIGADALLPSALTGLDRERLSAEAGALALARTMPAEILRRRRGRRVVITGLGRLARLIEEGLRDAGVGRVATRAHTAREPSRLAADRTDVPRVRVASASLNIEITAGRLPAAPPRSLLLVAVREGFVTVGPVVAAGHGPCLRCLELHRTERDPAWPQLNAQLPDAASQEPPCGAATAYAAAAHIIAEALAVLDGAPAALLGASIDVYGPTDVRNRRWDRHIGCDCRA
jgi:hypothetical protein